MFHERISKLAKLIVNYSLKIQKGERFLIEVRGNGTDAILSELIKETVAAGGVPFWNRHNDELQARFLKDATEEQIASWSQVHKLVMENIDAYVSIRGSDNAFEMSSVPKDHMKNYMKHYWEEVHAKIRVATKKWAVLRWPNYALQKNKFSKKVFRYQKG